MRRPPLPSRLPFADSLREAQRSLAQARRDDRDVDDRTRVYFIQESGMGAIKIGASKHAQKRAREIQDNMPHTITLLATVEGGRCVEAVLHSLFAHAYVRGEWFRPDPELLVYIEKEGELWEVTAKRELEVLFELRRNTRVLA